MRAFCRASVYVKQGQKSGGTDSPAPPQISAWLPARKAERSTLLASFLPFVLLRQVQSRFSFFISGSHFLSRPSTTRRIYRLYRQENALRVGRVSGVHLSHIAEVNAAPCPHRFRFESPLFTELHLFRHTVLKSTPGKRILCH